MDNHYNGYASYNNELYNEIKDFLHDSEQVLWIGKPCQSVKAPTSPFILIFTFFWLGFAIFWTVSATAIGGAFGLFGIPFLCIGVYMVYDATVGQKKRYMNTVYAVTDRRAVIVYHGYRGGPCNDSYFNHLQNISLSHVNGSVGTICFEQEYDGYYYGGRRYRSRPVGYEYKTSFIMIDNVHDVYRLISDQVSEK